MYIKHNVRHYGCKETYYTVYACEETDVKTENCHATLSERWRYEPSVGRAQRKGPLTLLGVIKEGFPEEVTSELSLGK